MDHDVVTGGRIDLHTDTVAFFVVQDRFPDRRLDADQVLQGIPSDRGDQADLLHFVIFRKIQVDRLVERDFIYLRRGLFDHDGIIYHFLQIGNAAFILPARPPRRVILEIFR